VERHQWEYNSCLTAVLPKLDPYDSSFWRFFGKKAVSLVQLPFYIPLDTPFSSFLADQVTIWCHWHPGASGRPLSILHSHPVHDHFSPPLLVAISGKWQAQWATIQFGQSGGFIWKTLATRPWVSGFGVWFVGCVLMMTSTITSHTVCYSQ
jgi:hypothetical protein